MHSTTAFFSYSEGDVVVYFRRQEQIHILERVCLSDKYRLTPSEAAVCPPWTSVDNWLFLVGRNMDNMECAC